MAKLKDLLIVVAAIACMMPISNISHAQGMQSAQFEDFEDVFALEDTIRLDQSVLIGRIKYLDVNASGELVIVDGNARKVYHFSSTGRLLHDLSVVDCAPGAMFSPHAARFIGDGQILVWDASYSSAYIFDSNGRCIKNVKSPHLVNINGMCAHGDTIYAMPIHSAQKAKAFSRDLDLLDEFELEPERWPVLITSMLVNAGRSLECFDDGAWYTYIYSMDATPIGRASGFKRYEPSFFVERKRDLQRSDRWNMLRLGEASSVVGLFRLDNSTRIVVHAGIGQRNRSLPGYGLTIVSHKDLFPPVSLPLLSRQGFRGAGNGMLYFTSDNELLDDGNLGNPMLIRYRFIPPKYEDE